MAKQAQKATQASDKQNKTEQAKQSRGEGLDGCTEMAQGLLAFQQLVGNQAVGRMIQGMRLEKGNQADIMRQMALVDMATPGSAPSGLIQLFRSGRVSGNVHYEEGPEDEIGIQIPFRIPSFEEILEGIDRVVQVFGSRQRTYTQETGFQDPLRAYLQSINHPSVGGSMMSRQRTIRIRIRLVRGERNRLERIEFISGEALPTRTREAPAEALETPETEATGEGVGAGAPTSEETAAPEPTVEQQPRERSLWSQFFSGVAAVEETVGDFLSARWFYNRVNESMNNLDHELDIINERSSRLPIDVQIMTPFFAMTFTVLRMITGLADLLAQLNPPSVVFQVTSRQARALAGDYGSEEFVNDLMALMRLNFNLTIFGILFSAWQHLREAYEEGNDYRFWMAMTEVLTAVITIITAARGARGAAAETGSTTTRTSGAPAEAPAPARTSGAPAEVSVPARSSTPAVEAGAAPARPSSTTGSTPAEVSTPARPTAPETGRPTETARPSEVPATGERGFSPEFEQWRQEREGRTSGSFEEGLAEWIARMEEEMGQGPSRRGIPVDRTPAYTMEEPLPDARVNQMVEQWAHNELDLPTRQYLSHDVYVFDYRFSGGWGRVPKGFIDSSGMLRFDTLQNLGRPELQQVRWASTASAVREGRPILGEQQPSAHPTSMQAGAGGGAWAEGPGLPEAAARPAEAIDVEGPTLSEGVPVEEAGSTESQGSALVESPEIPEQTGAETASAEVLSSERGSAFSPEFERWLADARSQGASHQEWIAGFEREMGAGESRPGPPVDPSMPELVREIPAAESIREMVEQWSRNELDIQVREYINPEIFTIDYRHGGGWGRVPTGWIDQNGVLHFDTVTIFGRDRMLDLEVTRQVAVSRARQEGRPVLGERRR